MKRPEHLPNFAKPPLDEVVIGVQFDPVRGCGYNSVHSMKVWELFKPEFPKQVEQPIIEPQFETFGGLNINAGTQIRLGAPPVGSCLCFGSEDETHLLHFQSDLLFANWRKRSKPQSYPRFESISKDFENNLKKLSKHFLSEFGYKIAINQAQVSYINIIPVDNFSEAGEWLRLLDCRQLNVESLNLRFSEVATDEENKPFARFKHEVQSAFTVDSQKKVLKLSLMYKGRPRKNDIASAMELLASGRDLIVTRFAEITTEEAHKNWGRT